MSKILLAEVNVSEGTNPQKIEKMTAALRVPQRLLSLIKIRIKITTERYTPILGRPRLFCRRQKN